MADHHAAPLRIGLTGGIASGKSTVADAFSALGVRVLSADTAARALTAPGTPLLASIRERFGARVMHDDGSLDRAALREFVFDDENARADLEDMLHPPIRAYLREGSLASRDAYVLLEVPLLKPSDVGTLVDRVLVVDLPESRQIERLVRRDGIDRSMALRMLGAQPGREERLAMANDVIDNSGAETDITDPVARLHALYLDIAQHGAPRRPGLG